MMMTTPEINGHLVIYFSMKKKRKRKILSRINFSFFRFSISRVFLPLCHFIHKFTTTKQQQHSLSILLLWFRRHFSFHWAFFYSPQNTFASFFFVVTIIIIIVGRSVCRLFLITISTMMMGFFQRNFPGKKNLLSLFKFFLVLIFVVVVIVKNPSYVIRILLSMLNEWINIYSFWSRNNNKNSQFKNGCRRIQKSVQ